MPRSGGFVIKNLDEAKHAVDWYHEHDYPQIKIYNSFPKAILADVTAYAHSKGMRVSGHIPVFLRAQEAVEQGYDEIQHINQVLLNFLVDDKTDTRTPERFYLPAEKVAGLDFDSKPVQDFLALLVRHKTVIDPTLTTFDFIRQRDGDMSQAYASVADHMPPDIQRNWHVRHDEDSRRCGLRALREIVREDDRLHRPHVQGGHSARRRHRCASPASRCSVNWNSTCRPASRRRRRCRSRPTTARSTRACSTIAASSCRASAPT